MKLRVKDLVLLSLVILLVGCGGNSSSPMDVVDDSQVSNPSNPPDSMTPVDPGDPATPLDPVSPVDLRVKNLSATVDRFLPNGDYNGFYDILRIQAKIATQSGMLSVEGGEFIFSNSNDFVCMEIDLDMSEAIYYATDPNDFTQMIDEIYEYNVSSATYESLELFSEFPFEYTEVSDGAPITSTQRADQEYTATVTGNSICVRAFDANGFFLIEKIILNSDLQGKLVGG